jgi:NitT/TauT family transport system permease protein
MSDVPAKITSPGRRRQRGVRGAWKQPLTDAAGSRREAASWEPLVEAELRAERRGKLTIQFLRLAILVIGIGLWQLVGTYFLDPFYISTPSAVGSRLAKWASDGTLLTNSWATIAVMLEGFGFGALGGIVIGLFLGMNRRTSLVLDPFIQAIYSVPFIALAPLFILWFGVGSEMRVVLTAVVVFFIIFWTSFAAIRSVDSELVDVIRIMGGRRWHAVFKVLLPGALPGVIHGIKMAVPYAVIGAIVAELLASSEGLGYLILRAQSQFDTAGIMAALVVLMVIAAIMGFVLRVIDNYANRWQADR